MNYEEFKEALVDELTKLLGEEVKLNLHTVSKNNGVCLDAITVLGQEENLAPTFYFKPWYDEYKQGTSVVQIAKYLCKQWYSNKLQRKIEVENFLNYGYVGPRVLFKLINYEKNKELLNEIPHEKVLDLALVCYYAVPEELVKHATVLIRNEQLQLWGITKEQLIEDAKHNTPVQMPYSYQSMERLLQDLLSESNQENDNYTCEEQWQLNDQEFQVDEGMDTNIAMYVLTNKMRQNGAACIMYPQLLEKVSETFNQNLYILPSSIHECIVIPESGTYSKQELENMVTEINATQVPLQEILSNHVYMYKRDEKKLVL